MLGADPGKREDDPDERECDLGEGEAGPGEREDEDSTALVGGPALPPGEADECGNSEYVLRVRVSDPSTASATVNVIVRVTEVNEPPAFDDDAPTLLSVVENRPRRGPAENKDSPVIRLGTSGDLIDAETYAVTDQDGSIDRACRL